MNDQKPGSSGKAAIIVAIIIVVIIGLTIGGYVYVTQKYKKEATNSFSLLMNHLFGQDGWQTEGYDFSLTQKTLTAKKVSVNPAKLDLPEASQVIIDSVVIVNGLRQDVMSNILKLSAWDSKTDTHLADQVTLLGTTVKAKDAEMSADVTIGKIDLTSLDLVAADGSGTAGTDKGGAALSFIKSARLGLFAMSDLSVVVDANAEGNFKIGLANVTDTDLRLGQNVTNLFDSFEVLKSYSVKDSVLNGLTFDCVTKDGDIISIKLEQQTLKDFSNFAASYYQIKDVSFNLEPKDDSVPFNFQLPDISINALDMLPFMERLNSITAEAAPVDSAEDVYSLYSKMYRLSDIFAMPYSFDSATLTGGSASIADGAVTITIEGATAEGPFVANKLPVSSNFELRNLKVNLPETTTLPKLKELAEFVSAFGQKTFNLSYSIHTTYDESTGTLKHAYSPLFAVEDLVTMNHGFTLTGLSPSLFEKFSQTPMGDFDSIVDTPEFQNLGVAQFRLEIIDRSLTEKLFNYYAKTYNQEIGLIKTGVKAFAWSTIMEELDDKLEDAPRIADAVAEFIDKPGSLVLEIAPSQALSMSSAKASGFDELAIVNSLNATFTVNGADPIPIKMSPPLPPAPTPGEPDDPGAPDVPDDLGDLGNQEGIGNLEVYGY
ncbi:MAG: hypothetical protein LBF58_04380 [Deltaproteobacteria bacterium]|jgi:flagellar basal body-associated protein FliL|nr:hypothetical protein [Deltaproteobacteria bacterium]